MKLDEMIEFFGFLPEQLLQDIEDNGKSTFHSDKQALDRFLLNFSIFKDYVTKHCFTPPESFSFERKICDKKMDCQLHKSINECVQIRDEIKYLIEIKARLENENTLNRYIIKKYTRLIEDMEILNSYKSANNEMDKRVDYLKEAFGRICEFGFDQNGSGIGMLMDNEGFKKEIENKERSDLVSTYDVSAMDELIEKHSKKQ